MELVEGVPITEFCEKNGLSIEQRLRLFIQVSQAVQHAHQKGIIHRDLKPSNVMVTLQDGAPVPKVIDFGVAKAINQRLTEKTLFTQHATLIGTPAYMSPEQAQMSPAGEGDVDTRSDIYGLGVLLYELLTGTQPFPERRLRSLAYAEMQRIILHEEPERPSTRLARSQLGNLVALQVMSDGRILAGDWAEPSRRIVRLLSDGSLDALFAFPDAVFYVAAQPDGKILLSARDTDKQVRLRRLNADGSVDPGFIATSPDCWHQIAFRSDGKIYISSLLRRLNSNGSSDRMFSPPHWAEEVPFFLRTNGKVLVGPWTGNQDRFVHLNDDGGVEAGFELEVPQVLSTEVWRRLPDLVERWDGRLFMGMDELTDDPDSERIGTVVQWRPDGSRGPNLALTSGGPPPEACSKPAMRVGSTGADRLFVTGGFHTMDGFPRPGLARLTVNPPERDFRVLTPAEFHRSDGSARVQVVRTGATTNAASVSFRTRDNTARGGEDYVPQSGRLDFAPLEVTKEIVVPLLAGNELDAPQRFDLELSQPSAGYEVIAATPIVILPDLRIVLDSLRPAADGSITLSARGTLPGRVYRLIGSADLQHWDWIADAQASGSRVTFENVPQRPPSQFFRASQANY